MIVKDAHRDPRHGSCFAAAAYVAPFAAAAVYAGSVSYNTRSVVDHVVDLRGEDSESCL
ncbi:hypothetical protein OH77DRAFT_1425032 [Trametes cingulata]|nr:hypothetical protein OH77DRAFT_1425032 [Trametes cingulata]